MVNTALVSEITHVMLKKIVFLMPTLFFVFMMSCKVQFVSHIYLYDANVLCKQK